MGGKSRPHGDSIPDIPARSSVAIPTELPGPLRMYITEHNCFRETEGRLKDKLSNIIMALKLCGVRV